MPKHIAWTLLILWASALIAGLVFYGQKQVTPFDPNGVLLHQSTDLAFDKRLVETLQANDISANTVLHVGSEKRCYCETVTEPHQLQLTAVLEEFGYQSQHIAIESFPNLADVITAVPALIVIDGESNLRYLGPYATGLGCFTGQTLIGQITQLATQIDYAGAVINADVEGCFCEA
ncbi:DUF6436 domain-containing protein [Alteromonas sp. KUL49]|uniref:DUF6436 domain-containing protein n=1 Tax=Alteromonas sp. KUL49 TaxID=2480798 RepID=UPI00102EEFC2|nr:DUF6436 domain-containing protein [Alteromonas sp. KUL49]TAP39334.1 thioredoxin [Alteromonas sp. KUL49]GEA12128.1 hypothetical protein KUL49_25030 [Alteromonas sp. KUL49]